MLFDAFTHSLTCECMNYYTACLECVFKWIFKSISWIRPDRVYWWVSIKDEYNHAFKVLHCKVAGIYRPFTDHCKNCKCWEPRNPVPSPFSAKIRKVNQNLESRREFGMWSGKLGKLGVRPKGRLSVPLSMNFWTTFRILVYFPNSGLLSEFWPKMDQEPGS